MHNLSLMIAERCFTRGWISEEDRPWCAYALEQKCLTLFFFLLLIPLVSILGVLPEAVIFSFVFYFFRRRCGGWHAPYAWLCQGSSISLVLVSTMIVGPMLMEIPARSIWVMNLPIMLIAFIRKPVYHPEMHFDHEITMANNRKKQQFLLFVFILQATLGCLFKIVTIYSLLGVLAGVASVYIELTKQYITRKREHHEEN